jgi:haloacetate dehalogenase
VTTFLFATSTIANMASPFSQSDFHELLVPIAASPTDPLLDDHYIYALRYRHPQSTKEPLLLLHGHPQNLYIYHRLAPALAKSAQRDIVVADLRGHGKSGVPKVRNIKEGEEKPSEDALRSRYSKREMARDMVELMLSFNYEKFAVVGHDRGGRVAHRMALDYPEMITRVMVLDIVPTLDLYNKTDAFFATAYWHWFFLIQPYPFPETMITSQPRAYLDKMVTRFNADGKVFPPELLKLYEQQLASPDHVHATCEDYRCSAPGGFDLELDEADRKAGRKITMPLRALWGAKGVNEMMFGNGTLDLWKNVSENATGRAHDCGHYMPEELPEEMEKEILDFFV